MGGGGRGALCQVKEGCLRRWSLREEEGGYIYVQCRPPTSSHSRALDSHSTRARLAHDSIECNNNSAP